MRIKLSQRALAAAAAALVAATGGAAAALAAAPIKAATYKGRLSVAAKPWHPKLSVPISFKVSANGRQVGHFAFNYPVYCQGGGFGDFRSRSGTITKQGTFKVKLPIYSRAAHSRQGFLIVTGSFARQGNESGKVTTDLSFGGACNGTSSYRTKG